MPLTRVSLRRGKSAAHRKAILDGVYRAMRETFDVPEEDRFMVISEHDEDNFSYSATYLDIKRSDDLVLIQLTVSNTRTMEKKKALYRRIVENLTADPGLRLEDVFINLVEVLPKTGRSVTASRNTSPTRAEGFPEGCRGDVVAAAHQGSGSPAES